jgi:hypothetical protein
MTVETIGSPCVSRRNARRCGVEEDSKNIVLDIIRYWVGYRDRRAAYFAENFYFVGKLDEDEQPEIEQAWSEGPLE